MDPGHFKGNVPPPPFFFFFAHILRFESKPPYEMLQVLAGKICLQAVRQKVRTLLSSVLFYENAQF